MIGGSSTSSSSIWLVVSLRCLLDLDLGGWVGATRISLSSCGDTEDRRPLAQDGDAAAADVDRRGQTCRMLTSQGASPTKACASPTVMALSKPRPWGRSRGRSQEDREGWTGGVVGSGGGVEVWRSGRVEVWRSG